LKVFLFSGQYPYKEGFFYLEYGIKLE